MRPFGLPPVRRFAAVVIGAAVVGGLAIAGAATGEEPAVGAPTDLTVSYEAPPPTLVLTPYASIEMPANPDFPEGIAPVAILPDGGAVAVRHWPDPAAILVGSDGSTSEPIAIDVAPSLPAATAGPVVYGLTPGSTQSEPAMGAIALAGPNTGHVVASFPVDRNTYIELPMGSFGNGPGGIVDRAREPGRVLAPHVDTNGEPVVIDGLRDVPTISPDDVVSDGAIDWPLVIVRHPESSTPYAGESPPAPGADGTSVFWTTIGPAADPSADYSENLQPVIAVLQPDGAGQWYSIPEGWSVVASDVGGTLFARRPNAGDTIELARLDPSATDAARCDDYEFNNAYPLRLCDSGAAVRLAQTGLAAVDPELSADGYFGPVTERAVRTFQAQHGLEVDGLVGPDTWTALTADIAVGTDVDSNGVIEPWELGAEPDGAGESQRWYYWVLVLASAPEMDDPVILAAMDDLEAAGYLYGVAITGCEVGSSEALGHPAGEVVVSVQFPSEAEALAAQAQFAAQGVTGAVAYVSTTCLD